VELESSTKTRAAAAKQGSQGSLFRSSSCVSQLHGALSQTMTASPHHQHHCNRAASSTATPMVGAEFAMAEMALRSSAPARLRVTLIPTHPRAPCERWIPPTTARQHSHHVVRSRRSFPVAHIAGARSAAQFRRAAIVGRPTESLALSAALSAFGGRKSSGA
jgi:hypothetical protein